MAVSLSVSQEIAEPPMARVSREPCYRLEVDGIRTNDVEIGLSLDDSMAMLSSLLKVFTRPVEGMNTIDPSKAVVSRYWRQSPERYSDGERPGILRFRAFMPGYNYRTRYGDKGSDCVIGFAQAIIGSDAVYLAEWHAHRMRKRSFVIFDPKLLRLGLYDEIDERGVQFSLLEDPSKMSQFDVDSEVAFFESIVDAIAEARRGNNRYTAGMRGGFRLIHPMFK